MPRYSICIFIPIVKYSVPLFQQDREAFKLHGGGIRGSQALSIALQG